VSVGVLRLCPGELFSENVRYGEHHREQSRTAAESGDRGQGSRNALGRGRGGSARRLSAAGETVARRLSVTRGGDAGAWQSRTGPDECHGRGDPPQHFSPLLRC